MELTTAAVPFATTAIMPDIMLYDAAARNQLQGIFGGSDPRKQVETAAGLTIRASFCPYCEFAGAAVSASDAAAPFPPFEALPRGRGSSLPRTQSPQDSGAFVYGGPGAEGYVKRPVEPDYFSFAFMNAGGLVLIPTVSAADAPLDVPECERGGLSCEGAADTVGAALNLEGTRGISAEHERGNTAGEAVYDTCDVYGGAYECGEPPDVRVMPYGMSMSNTACIDGFASIHHMVEEYGEEGRDDAGRDDAQGWN